MRKIICYTWGLGLFLAGATTFGAGQDSPLPPPPPPLSGGTATPSHVLPDTGPIPTPDDGLSPPVARVTSPSAVSGPSLAASPDALAPISMSVPPANSGGPPPSPGRCVIEPRDCPCCHHDACCYGIRPLGGCVCASIHAQVDNGIAAQMVLYNYDFNDPALGDPAKLNPFGLRRLTSIERYLQSGCNYPVIVEGTIGNPAIDSARQMHVAGALGEAGMTPQVVVGETPATFSGAESLLAYGSRLQQFREGGPGFNRQTTTNTGAGGTTSSGSNGQGISQ